MIVKQLLSILIPVYNASKWIERCLESIVSLPEFIQFVRIICVDDGSSDTSLSILEKCKDKYGNLEIISRENRGIGASRNELLDHVKTPYFWFVDADDYISSDSFSCIIPLLKQDKYDMLLMGYFWGNALGEGKDVLYGNEEYASGVELSDKGIFNNSLWTRVYRTSVAKSNNIHFRNYQMGEDFDFIFKMIPHLGKVKCIDKVLYYYIVNPNSAITAPSMEHKIRASEHSLQCMEENYASLKSFPNNIQMVLRKPLNHFLMGYLYSVYVVPFTMKYKKVAFVRLKKMGAVPVSPLPDEKKKRMFSRIVNIGFLRGLSLYMDAFYLMLKNGNR